MNIGFVSTRLAGTDGVSLETRKWVRVLTRFGHRCFYFAGESEWPPEQSRVVPRKRIEQAIELVRRLDVGCTLVISHASGDEGTAYGEYLRELADLLGVRVLFAAERFGHSRGEGPDGQPVFSLADAYLAADLVTYPSTVEGFGNAFLETIYYRRPIVMSIYEIFRRDIQPKGFRVIGFENFTNGTIEEARAVLPEPDLAREMGEHNFELGRRFYSLRVLEDTLRVVLDQMGLQ